MTEASIEESTLDAVARILGVLHGQGLRSALVGAAALAVHGYSRATEDVDVGVATPSLDALRAAADAIRATLGVSVSLAAPDSEDPLGGVITIQGPHIRQILVINFLNPLGIGDHPGREAIGTALPLTIAGAAASVVDLEHLVAMKLFAGGMRSKADVVELLAYNPAADVDGIGALCARFGLGEAWTALLPDIAARRGAGSDFSRSPGARRCGPSPVA